MFKNLFKILIITFGVFAVLFLNFQTALAGNCDCTYADYYPYSRASDRVFGDWSGVRNMDNFDPANPFADWSGVRNMDSINNSNPLAGWSGVRNMDNFNLNNPLADWSGVRNMDNFNSTNPLAGWSGVKNMQSFDPSNPLSGWSGVRNIDNFNPTNPLADWSGVRNMDSWNIGGGFSDWSGVKNFPLPVPSTQANIPTQQGSFANNKSASSLNGLNSTQQISSSANENNFSDFAFQAFGQNSDSNSQNNANFNAEGYQIKNSLQQQVAEPVARYDTQTNYVPPKAGADYFTPIFFGLVMMGLLFAVKYFRKLVFA